MASGECHVAGVRALPPHRHAAHGREDRDAAQRASAARRGGGEHQDARGQPRDPTSERDRVGGDHVRLVQLVGDVDILDCVRIGKLATVSFREGGGGGHAWGSRAAWGGAGRRGGGCAATSPHVERWNM